MLWHRQAIFESKGDKLSSSAESRIRTQGVYETQSSADWMPAEKPTELSRIKLKNLNSTARPYDQQAFRCRSHMYIYIYIYIQLFLYIYVFNYCLYVLNSCIQFIIILHTAPRWQRQVCQTLTSQQSPDLALKGVLWGVYCQDFGENSPRYNGIVLCIYRGVYIYIERYGTGTWRANCVMYQNLVLPWPEECFSLHNYTKSLTHTPCLPTLP